MEEAVGSRRCSRGPRGGAWTPVVRPTPRRLTRFPLDYVGLGRYAVVSEMENE